MKITPAQMARWRMLEAEHTKNRFQQEKIVRDHVREHGIQYYPALIKMERGLKKR
jgi:hypothetical protein